MNKRIKIKASLKRKNNKLPPILLKKMARACFEVYRAQGPWLTGSNKRRCGFAQLREL